MNKRRIGPTPAALMKKHNEMLVLYTKNVTGRVVASMMRVIHGGVWDGWDCT
jgi:hypothetical protein